MKDWKDEATRLWDTGLYTQRYISDKLGVPTSTLNDFLLKYAPPRDKKILIFDIETAPMEVYAWSLWDKYTGHDFIIQDWTVLTWSAKWLGSDGILNASVSPSDPRDDFDVCEALWQLLDTADYVVAHNGDKFDINKMNTRFLMHGLPEPNVFKSIDTLKVAKRKFKFSSNRLDHIGSVLVDEKKIKHEGFSMWKKCLAGDADALKDMVKYNDQDVLLLEKVYLKLRGWDSLHPSLTVRDDTSEEILCPTCGSDEMVPTGRFAQTQTGIYATHRCGQCGKISKERRADKTAKQKKALVRPV